MPALHNGRKVESFGATAGGSVVESGWNPSGHPLCLVASEAQWMPSPPGAPRLPTLLSFTLAPSLNPRQETLLRVKTGGLDEGRGRGHLGPPGCGLLRLAAGGGGQLPPDRPELRAGGRETHGPMARGEEGGEGMRRKVCVRRGLPPTVGNTRCGNIVPHRHRGSEG